MGNTVAAVYEQLSPSLKSSLVAWTVRKKIGK